MGATSGHAVVHGHAVVGEKVKANLVVSEEPAEKEEVCSCCSRNKNIGSKCWWCGC